MNTGHFTVPQFPGIVDTQIEAISPAAGNLLAHHVQLPDCPGVGLCGVISRTGTEVEGRNGGGWEVLPLCYICVTICSGMSQCTSVHVDNLKHRGFFWKFLTGLIVICKRHMEWLGAVVLWGDSIPLLECCRTARTARPAQNRHNCMCPLHTT
jgi:hypothetical protein